MKPITTILEAKDRGFDPGPFVKDDVYFKKFYQSHKELIENHNGLYAFDRALHIFGFSEMLGFHDIKTRNLPMEWRLLYGNAVDGLIFFAEEVFGNLFAYDNSGNIVLLNVESAEIELVLEDFDEWMEYITEDIDYTTGKVLAQEWAASNGQIPFGSHLCPKKPFIIGGEYEIDNLYVLSWEKSLLFKADIARQIRDLPDGTDVILE